MKFIAFSVRDDERPYFEQFEQKNDVKVTLVADALTKDTMHQAKGYDAIIALQTGQYPDELYGFMAEEGIKSLAIRNVGTDNLNLDLAKEKGIIVTNVPAYSPAAIAEFSVTQLMQLLRNIPTFNHKIAQRDFRWAPNIARELNEMTVGIIGTGRIGRAAMQIYQGFGAKVIAYDPYHAKDLEEQGIYVDTLQALYQQADVITLHMPGSKHDTHMIDADAFAMMKDGVYIVNTARGALIDTKALIAAIKSGKVAGAVLDTYEGETPLFNHDWSNKPVQDTTFNELLALDQVLMTPHIAFYTTTAVKNMVTIACDSAKSVVTTGDAPTRQN